MLLAHIQIVHQHSQSHFCKCFLAGLYPVLVRRVIPPLGQDLAFPFVKLHEIALCPFLQPDRIPLNGSTTPIFPVKFSVHWIPCIRIGICVSSSTIPGKPVNILFASETTSHFRQFWNMSWLAPRKCLISRSWVLEKYTLIC